jgi:hypothetical protein
MHAVTARAIVTRLWDGQPQNDVLIPDRRQRLGASKRGSYPAKAARASSTPPTQLYVVPMQRMLSATLSSRILS